MAINGIRDHIDQMSNQVAMKLIENKLVETTNKNGLEEQINKALETLSYAEDFDVDYEVAPFRKIVTNPHIVSLYLTAFVIEKLINHKDTVDIYGSDDEIYHCINHQVKKFLP